MDSYMQFSKHIFEFFCVKFFFVVLDKDKDTNNWHEQKWVDANAAHSLSLFDVLTPFSLHHDLNTRSYSKLYVRYWKRLNGTVEEEGLFLYDKFLLNTIA